ncbi:LysR substrate-binding domain-containing protein [Flavobacterium sp.]|uniref:LysR family transcriptional regulator n=1 Tax=Flavobacterium sp. TaxID=239 RepID=UPI001B4F69A7|nr:LysR substrate-binding domain-containing protein [Flavobacterium sp.]MBP6181056.1 LysR family transcriptional regulator [Flavobacterium sp.]
MELRKLKSFLVVAKELHFGKAAEKLNITQPALTHQIQQLESELGFDLFDKVKRVNNRKVELTEAGVYLMKEISRVIELLDRTIKNAKINSEKRKQLKLGIPKICLVNEVMEVLKNLQLKFPDTTFKIVEYSSVVSVQEALFKGNIDVGITTFPLVFKDLDYKIFKNEFLNVIMPKKHPLAKYQKIKIEQLRNDKWVELTKDLCPPSLDDVEVYCRNAGFSRNTNIVQEVSNIELLIGLVHAGIGIAVFPSHYPILSEEIVSKELLFSDNNRLKITKILVFKDTLDKEYQQTIKNTW